MLFKVDRANFSVNYFGKAIVVIPNDHKMAE